MQARSNGTRGPPWSGHAELASQPGARALGRTDVQRSSMPATRSSAARPPAPAAATASVSTTRTMVDPSASTGWRVISTADSSPSSRHQCHLSRVPSSTSDTNRCRTAAVGVDGACGHAGAHLHVIAVPVAVRAVELETEPLGQISQARHAAPHLACGRIHPRRALHPHDLDVVTFGSIRFSAVHACATYWLRIRPTTPTLNSQPLGCVSGSGRGPPRPPRQERRCWYPP